MSKSFVALWRGQVVILHKRLFGSSVEFAFGVEYISCELGPISDFILICEL